ncbi:MAG: hypothetical protein II879_11025 [Clostridia bacterium]|nr:hypothetical protein [Clostridia bacterium]
MSLKRWHEPEKQEETVADYYQLKKEAVNDLVTANEENSPPVSEEEIRKYTRRHGIHLADWVKALLIKWWFPAAVCYFFFWGLGVYIQNALDLLLITAIALGFVTDLLTNNVLRFIARQEGANDRWMMYPKKKFSSLVLNIIHACVCMVGVYTLYNALNRLVIAVGRLETDSVPIGVEPILFGLFFLLWDLLLIGAKRLFGQALQDAKQKVDAGE